MIEIESLICAVVAIIPGGLFLLVWSIRVWRKSDYVRSIGFMYKYFMRWLPDDAEPTEGQIKAYAALGFLMGTMGVLVGLLAIWGFFTLR